MSAAKDKGTKAERDVVEYLNESGFPKADRILQQGRDGLPDVYVMSGFTVQVKNWKTMSLALWVDEAVAQRVSYGMYFNPVWHHRKGKGHPRDWYVTMTGREYVELLKYIRGLQDQCGKSADDE